MRRSAWPIVALLGLGLPLLLSLAWIVTHPIPPPSAPPMPAIERQARRFVRLALTLGAIAPSEVDGYFGPADFGPPPGKPSLPALRADLAELSAELHADTDHADGRRARLQNRTDRLLALVNTMGPMPPLPFDEEADKLYGLPPASLDQRAFAAARTELDALLPGAGPLARRVEAFRQRFLVPPERRQAVFGRAMAECRRRTLTHWRLPPSEHLDVRWTDTVEAAWHRYDGDFTSTLRINPATVAFLGSIAQVACHEGYPGHHVQFALAEAAAGPNGLAIEDRVVLLRSPASVLREGAADFAVSLAFPPAERLAFDRDVLMPLAGLPATDAIRFEHIRELLDRLAPAAYPILRGYRDGRLGEAAAATALERDALVASPRALLAFTDATGAYVAGYTAVREQVRRVVMAPGGDPWTRLRCLLSQADDAPLARSPPIDAARCAEQAGRARR